ncbi:DUF262 domain-containing protein [Burkholderia ubonensis]|uniref:DUF262 domain-containing protein n=1 Tax=Burkholderia ubonensis TaxID=101571 RepID=UPI000B2B9733|nr:DUF262 domain-containing protein [Burkholderia ubonensis]
MSDAMSGNNVSSLIEEVDLQLKNVHTQGLDISFNELVDMIDTGELDISPAYQRLFQWSEGARSRFIESLLLEMPVPPIYVVEEEDNRKLLIDGLQRLSSYMHFRGLLDAPHFDPPIKKGDFLVLRDCDIIPSLNGKTFKDLGQALQIKLRRSFVRVEVIRRGSNPRFKYHMFKRLNTGGTSLSPQQLRNCTIRLLDPKFNDYIIRLAEKNDFKTCTMTISDEQKISDYREELVLRFFAFKNWRDKYSHDIADFLTDYMEAVSDPENPEPFDYDAEEADFDKTFSILARTLAEKAFSRANGRLDDLVSGFGVYQYEAFTLGLQPHLQRIAIEEEGQIERFNNIFRGIKLDRDFVNLTTGGGKNSPGPLGQRIGFVEAKVAEAL